MDAYGGFIFVCEGEKEVKNLCNSIRRERSCSVVMDNNAFYLINLSSFWEILYPLCQQAVLPSDKTTLTK
jgi:hypothetical protein